MNNKLLKELKSKMFLYASNVNKLIKKYNTMKNNGVSIIELNDIAIKAHEFNTKYSEVKSDYEEYVSKYEMYSSLSRFGGKKYEDARESFIACQISLIFKYGIEEDLSHDGSISEVKNDNEVIEEYTHCKPKKGSKLLAGALALVSALGLGYGLSACTHGLDEAPIVDVDTDTEEKNNEKVKNDDEVTMPELNPDDIENTDIKDESKSEENNNEEVTVIEENKEEEVNTNETITTNDFAYLKETSSLYDSEEDDKQELASIEKYQKVLRLSTDGIYDYVQTEDLQYGYIESSKLEVLPDMYVEVDISDQTVELYKDKDIILTTLCVTGKDSTPTRIGYFPIKYKTYDTYLKGPGYKSHVYYWMPFDGGIGLHDAAWRSEFGGDIHYNSGSHGCVNMPHDAAKTIYENVSAGTKVLVHN